MAELFLHILNAGNRFDAETLEKINRAVRRAEKFAKQKLLLGSVDIVCAAANYTIDFSGGISGYTPNQYLIYINIDLESNSLNEDDIYVTLCHELAHATRYNLLNYADNRNVKLLEYAVFEGLGVAIECESLNGKDSKFSREMKKRKNTAELIERYQPKFNSSDYSSSDFRDGNADKGIPRWAIYEIGYYLVRKKLRENGANASQLLGLQPDVFCQIK